MFGRLLLCPTDDTDMAVSLEHCQQHVTQFGNVTVESHVLEDVMFAQAIAARCSFVER